MLCLKRVSAIRHQQAALRAQLLRIQVSHHDAVHREQVVGALEQETGRKGLPVSRGCRQLGMNRGSRKRRVLAQAPQQGDGHTTGLQHANAAALQHSSSKATAHLELKRELLAHGEHLARVAQGQVRRQLPRIKLPLHVLLRRRLGDEAHLQAAAAACEANAQQPTSLIKADLVV